MGNLNLNQKISYFEVLVSSRVFLSMDVFESNKEELTKEESLKIYFKHFDSNLIEKIEILNSVFMVIFWSFNL